MTRVKKYSEEEKQFLIDNCKGRYAKELTIMFNERFNENLTEYQIKNFKNRNHLKSGLDCRFGKLNKCPGWNKGIKRSEYMSKESEDKCSRTQFKKGNIPINHKQVGSERITVDGYIEIKVAEPNKWKLKHRVLWEKANGNIPEGYILAFADGNKLNMNLDNLILLNRNEHMRMIQNGLYGENPEATKVGLQLAKLINKSAKLKKDKGSR